MWLERKSCKENSQRDQGILEIKRGRQKYRMILMKIKACLGNGCRRLNKDPPIDLMELEIKNCDMLCVEIKVMECWNE